MNDCLCLIVVCLHILVKKISKSSKNMRFSYSFHYEISEKYPLMHLQNMFYQIFLLRFTKTFKICFIH